MDIDISSWDLQPGKTGKLSTFPGFKQHPSQIGLDPTESKEEEPWSGHINSLGYLEVRAQKRPPDLSANVGVHAPPHFATTMLRKAVLNQDDDARPQILLMMHKAAPTWTMLTRFSYLSRYIYNLEDGVDCFEDVFRNWHIASSCCSNSMIEALLYMLAYILDHQYY